MRQGSGGGDEFIDDIPEMADNGMPPQDDGDYNQGQSKA